MATATRAAGTGPRQELVGWLFVAPALLGFTVFYLYPILNAFRISLTDWTMLSAPTFVGFDNYVRLFDDPEFWHAAWITFLYVLVNIPLQTVLALLLATLLDRLARSMVLRVVVVAPFLISNVIVAMIWLWFLDPMLGLANSVLTALGLPWLSYLSSPDWAIVWVAVINTWRHTGFTALLFFAGMQAIPKSLYEAGRLDGAGEVTLFRRITLPLLRPVLLFVLVTTIVGSFQVFDTVAVATAGGPANSTSVLVWYIYENAFTFYQMGYASAASVVLFATLVLVTIMQMRLLRGNSSALA